MPARHILISRCTQFQLADLVGETGPLHLEFEPGTHHFYPDEAFEKYYYISNNRHSLKRIALPLINRNDVTIEGNGSRWVFHGEILPIVVENCRNVSLRNFSIDWERPFYSQAEVVHSDEDRIELEIDPDLYPHLLDRGALVFQGEGWSHGLNEGLFEMDHLTRAPAYLSGDNLGGFSPSEFFPSLPRPGRIRFENRFPRPPKVGNIILLRHFPRLCPGIHLKQSRDISIQNVALHHAGGMGVIAQFCEDIHVDGLRIEPAPGSGRLFSVTVDATHWVNCRGIIRIENSRFSHQMDDPANIHGTNTRILRVEDAHTLITERVHPEQHGVEIAFPGDRMSLAANSDLLAYADCTVESVEEINSRYCRLRFREALPDISPGSVLDNLDWQADAEIRKCHSECNRARGYLLSTPGRIRLEDNHISAAGAAVKISGDANFWFESGAVRDVLIRGNRFGDCCYGPPEWGRAVIDIDPEIADPWENRACFHRNIRILENTFRTFDTGLLFARSVDGLEFRDNRIETSGTHPSTARLQARITLEACRNFLLEAPEDPDGCLLVEQKTAADAPQPIRPQTSLDA